MYKVINCTLDLVYNDEETPNLKAMSKKELIAKAASEWVEDVQGRSTAELVRYFYSMDPTVSTYNR